MFFEISAGYNNGMQAVWVVTFDDGESEKFDEFRIFKTIEGLYVYLDKFCARFAADGDFHDDGGYRADRLRLGLTIKDYSKICDAINSYMREIYHTKLEHLQITYATVD